MPSHVAHRPGNMSLSFGGILVSVFFIIYTVSTVRSWSSSLSNLESGIGLLTALVVLLVVSVIAFRRRAKRLGIRGAIYGDPRGPKPS